MMAERCGMQDGESKGVRERGTKACGAGTSGAKQKRRGSTRRGAMLRVHVCAGESIQDAVNCLLEMRCTHLKAILVNCSSPKAVTAALRHLTAMQLPHSIRLGAYANGFTTTTSEWLSGSADSGCLPRADEEPVPPILSEKEYAQHCKDWYHLGATLIGGCCGIGPSHMQVVRDTLRSADVVEDAKRGDTECVEEDPACADVGIE